MPLIRSRSVSFPRSRSVPLIRSRSVPLIRSRSVQWLAFVFVTFFLVGCPRAKRHILQPTLPEHSNPTAKTRFLAAYQQFLRDQTQPIAEFSAIAQEFPDDPIADHARLYAGISALRQGQYDLAIQTLTALDRSDTEPALHRRVKLFLGLALGYSGKYDQARPHLHAGQPTATGKTEQQEWTAALAEATHHGPNPLSSLRYYQTWFSYAGHAERAYIITQVKRIANQASLDQLRYSYANRKRNDSLIAAIAGPRLAAEADASGQQLRATRIRAETKQFREKLSKYSPDMLAPTIQLGPPKIGALLPLVGQASRIGQLALRGVALATGTVGESSEDATATVSIRDSSTLAANATSTDDLLLDPNVIAILGPMSDRGSKAISERASGVAHLSLSPRVPKSLRGGVANVYYLIHTAEARSRALARHAFGLGIRNFAILAPNSGYGRATTRAFRSEVQQLGGRVVVSAKYPAKATAFTAVIDQLNRSSKRWQAVFVPDQATRLELIAPALAAANLIARPYRSQNSRKRRNRRNPQSGRTILLLSTAEFLAPRFIQSSARYTQGAIFAPGFYPDRADGTIGDFVDRYEHAFGRLPTTIEAYAYDATTAVRTAMQNGATTRQQLLTSLQSTPLAGVTGSVIFSPTGRRLDPGVLFTVRKNQSGDFLIRRITSGRR